MQDFLKGADGLRAKALELGADDAKVLPVDAVAVEDEVLAMCRKPHCDGYGKTVNCPPHTMQPAEFRNYMKRFQSAVVFKTNVPVDAMMAHGSRNKAFFKIYDIAAKLEKAARESGFAVSEAYGAGSCKPVFCGGHKACRALDADQACRHPDLARPAMEAVGMNVMKVVREAGWTIENIDQNTHPDAVSNVVLAGMVFIG